MNLHGHTNTHICGQCGKEYCGSKSFLPRNWDFKINDENHKTLLCDDCCKLENLIISSEQPTIIGLKNISATPMPVQNSIAIFCGGECINFTLSESKEIVAKFSEAISIMDGQHSSQLGNGYD